MRAKHVTVHARTVLIHVNPAPRTFAERHAVLLALKKYSPIHVFKKITYEGYPRFIAVADTLNSVDQMVKQSPMVFKAVFPSVLNGLSILQAQMPLLGLDLKPKVFHISAGGGARAQEEKEKEKEKGKAKDKEADDAARSRDFSMTVSRFEKYRHSISIESNPRHGPWPYDDAIEAGESGGLARSVLRKVMPPGVAAKGMSRWDIVIAGSEGARGNATMARMRTASRNAKRWEQENLLPGVMAGWLSGDGRKEGEGAND